VTQLDPTAAAERALSVRAEAVSAELCEQEVMWDKGFTRRRFLAGVGMVGVAALGSQLVTTKVAYGATPANGNTLITIFLRGAADGLRILVPAGAEVGGDYLRTVRPKLVPADANLIALPGAPGWAVNTAMAKLMPLWGTGELAFVPAVSIASLSRSHFTAQQLIERGGSLSATTGWLDRTLQQLGPGTTFRAVSEGSSMPFSMSGVQPKLSMSSLKNFSFPGWTGVTARSEAALRTLYRGVSGPLGQDVPEALAALATAQKARTLAGPKNGAAYPSGNVSTAMIDLATLLRAESGVQVATVDIGGWDTHTNEAGDLDRNLTSLAATLQAFMQDLGPTRRKRVTVAVVTEFGRRVSANASGGTDHGHGSVMWLLGGGVVGGVHGKWNALSAGTLDNGDVPMLNNAFDVLGEVAQKRLGIGSISTIFPGHALAPLGVSRVG
jgi:uncharacterized protein (DUF1501 family)